MLEIPFDAVWAIKNGRTVVVKTSRKTVRFRMLGDALVSEVRDENDELVNKWSNAGYLILPVDAVYSMEGGE
jgi:myo-inositol catabolism protein IolC